KGKYLIRWCLRRHKYIMLNDEIIPIEYPYGSVRADFGMYGTIPLIRTGCQVPTIMLFEAGTIRFDNGIMDKPHGGFGDKGHPVPIALRVIPCGVKLMPRCCSKASYYVDLPEVGCHGMYVVMTIDFLYRVDPRPTLIATESALHQLLRHGVVGTVGIICR